MTVDVDVVNFLCILFFIVAALTFAEWHCYYHLVNFVSFNCHIDIDVVIFMMCVWFDNPHYDPTS